MVLVGLHLISFFNQFHSVIFYEGDFLPTKKTIYSTEGTLEAVLRLNTDRGIVHKHASSAGLAATTLSRAARIPASDLQPHCCVVSIRGTQLFGAMSVAINLKLASRPASVIRRFGRLLGGGYCFLRCTRQVQTRGSERGK